ncbi:hypothetical protein [Thermococcus celer]|uniref:Uncharacterized protein n=1 Tax=Thermococcus celer Vu 13 = JCM 8558 TaxID=1293037 RepID=A0A218P1B8_THECE|nr:hypothetical protein [Thermococcus celer]ASI98728.1 hypothetical protein A3L02_03695 [Thermococcus celer Vu 13 = JCM 8558]
MIEFVILLGVIGGWVIVASTLFLMLALGKMWGLAGVLLLILAIQINHWLKGKYMRAIVDATPRAKAIAAHIFEMNELILLSSYLISVVLYVVIQKYVEIVIKVPHVMG